MSHCRCRVVHHIARPISSQPSPACLRTISQSYNVMAHWCIGFICECVGRYQKFYAAIYVSRKTIAIFDSIAILLTYYNILTNWTKSITRNRRLLDYETTRFVQISQCHPETYTICCTKLGQPKCSPNLVSLCIVRAFNSYILRSNRTKCYKFSSIYIVKYFCSIVRLPVIQSKVWDTYPASSSTSW